MLGAVAGFAVGAAILVGAPGVGPVARTESTRSDRPATRRAVAVAAVIAPAQAMAIAATPDRWEAGP